MCAEGDGLIDNIFLIDTAYINHHMSNKGAVNKFHQAKAIAINLTKFILNKINIPTKKVPPQHC